jgi:hypothetical protein
MSPSPLGFNMTASSLKKGNQSKIVDVKGSSVDFANITVNLNNSTRANMNQTAINFDKNDIIELANSLQKEF